MTRLPINNGRWLSAPTGDLLRIAMAAVGRAPLPHMNGAKLWPPPAVRWFVYHSRRFYDRAPWVVSSRGAFEVAFP